MNRSKQLDLLLYIWYIIFFISMVCCLRAVSSITIGLILITGIYKNKIDNGSWLNKNLQNGFLAACCLYYFLQIIALPYTSDLHEAGKNLQTKSAILFVPLALCCSNFLTGQVKHKLMKYFVWILAVPLLFCLLLATYKYQFMKAQSSVFFYHELLIPFKQHAVQLSVILFIVFVYLLERVKKGRYLYNKPVHFALILYFTCFILLLSSKLVIVFSTGCFVYYIVLILNAKVNSRFTIFMSLFTGLAMIILVLATQNRVSSRFTEIVSGDIKLAQQQKFDPGIYFNGLQFRLLQWRFVKDILTEHNAWLTGVSDDAQILLDKKYNTTHMYIGDGSAADRGYLGYNTHNQFLESLLRSGMLGLLAFILICLVLLRTAFRKRNRELMIVVIMLIAYCFNESVFETQYGIMLFTFFPLFIYYGITKKHRPQ